MGWIQKLCDVYDVVSRVDISEENNRTQLVRVGFTKKAVRYEITVAADGEFSSVSVLGKDDCECVVPTTPEAEGRTRRKWSALSTGRKPQVFCGGSGRPQRAA